MSEPLLMFFRCLVNHFGSDQAQELDLFEFCEMAESAGLIRWEVYKPEVHGEMDDVEPGDMIWLPTL